MVITYHVIFFHSEGHGKLTVFSVKSMLATMCGGKILDKLRCKYLKAKSNYFMKCFFFCYGSHVMKANFFCIFSILYPEVKIAVCFLCSTCHLLAMQYTEFVTE